MLVYEAELSGISRALVVVKTSAWRTCRIFTGSQAALASLTSVKALNTSRLVFSVHQAHRDLIHEGRFMELVWIPGHTGIPGNETADAAAKRALQHLRVDYPWPLSLDAVKLL